MDRIDPTFAILVGGVLLAIWTHLAIKDSRRIKREEESVQTWIKEDGQWVPAVIVRLETGRIAIMSMKEFHEYEQTR